jgi:hypothetical protein
VRSRGLQREAKAPLMRWAALAQIAAEHFMRRTLTASFRAASTRRTALATLAFPRMIPPCDLFPAKESLQIRQPFTAMLSRRSILRQMAAARAITFTSVTNDSMTTSPLYLIFFSATTIAQSM